MLESILQWMYNRTHGRLARILFASVAGAIAAVSMGLTHGRAFARERWEWLVLAGLAVGLVGGAMLTLQERRVETNLPLPLWWRLGRRLLWLFALLAFAILFPVLVYTMWLVTQT